MSRDDFGDFPRGGAFGDLTLDDMRAQMEKDREAFFRDRGDWTAERPSGLFSRVSTSYIDRYVHKLLPGLVRPVFSTTLVRQ